MRKLDSMRGGIAAAAFLMALSVAPLRGETLREVLRANDAPAVDQGLPNLDRRITSFEVLNNTAAFTIAYYLDDDSGTLQEPLIISRYTNAARKWQTAQLDRKAIGDDSCLGSAIGATSSTGRLYLEMHINPSASCTLVVSPNLTVERILYGWVVGTFDDGRIVYENNEVHFAPIHAAELSLFNPQTAEDMKLYPRKPFQPVRAAHIEKLRVFFGANPDWCNAHDNPCDPEWFNNDVSGVVVNAVTDSLAFVARLDNTDSWSDADRVKLEAFRETRGYLRKQPGINIPNDALLGYFVSDLGRIERMNQKQQVVDLFAAGDDMRGLLEAAFAARDAAPPNGSGAVHALPAAWTKPETWKRLVAEIQVLPEFTDVLYVYRYLRSSGSVEYREMLLDDWKARFGDIPIAKSLDLLNLGKMFQQ